MTRARASAGIVFAFAVLFVAALPVAQPAAAQAILRGRVVVDTIMQPIADAEILLPGLGKSTKSDAKGAFQLPGWWSGWWCGAGAAARG